MSSLRETLLSTTDQWVQAHQSRDMTAVAALRTPITTYKTLPKSLNAPVRNNEDWDAFFPASRKLFARNELTIHDTFVDEEKRKVILVTSEQGEAAGDKPVKYDNQCIFLITMDESGEKVVEHVVFMDSAFMMGFMREIGVGGGPKGS